ncbi:MAG: serine/threonine protein kinase [Xenococcaceae cyanobacterium]
MNCYVCGHKNPTDTLTCLACGAQLNAPTKRLLTASSEAMGILPLGTQLLSGVYKVEGVLGQGGFGITYQASDTRLNRVVALKEFFPEGCWRKGTTVVSAGKWTEATYTNAKDKFLQEGQAIAQFNHPGIVRVFYYFEENNTAYMVMEYLQGRSLADLLKLRGGLLSESESLFYVQKIAEALEVIHAARFLHQDIKPDNVMLTDDDRVVLIDFGAARDFAAKNKNNKLFTTMLTPGYAPLEQYGQLLKLGTFTDVYALGATLYHLLTGEVPASAVERAAGVELTPIAHFNSQVTPSVERAVMQAMTMEVTNRVQSVSDFLTMLDKDRYKGNGEDISARFYRRDRDPWTAFSPSDRASNNSTNNSNPWF